jgi:mRNA-degrading endonuclease toxin of MazEF toxin-antitoxin module
VSYGRFDVVLVLFPFTEKKGRKQRPAIVLSNRQFNAAHQHSIVAMVTTASVTKWPSDVPISGYMEAGLLSPCVARAKLFTISDDLVIGRVGILAGKDSTEIGGWVADLVSDSSIPLEK